MMKTSLLKNLEPRRLRRLMCLFFIAMALPSAILVYTAYDQLKWEAFYQHRQLAEELANRIDKQLIEFVEKEESRSFSDYSFIVVEGNDQANYLERSELSEFPIANNTAGIVGYFQVDADGRFSSPLVPSSLELAKRYGLGKEELEQRQEAQQRVQNILSTNKLVDINAAQIASSSSSLSFEADDYLSDGNFEESTDQRINETGLKSKSNRFDNKVSNSNQAAFDKLSQVKKQKDSIELSTAVDKDSVLGRLQELESPYEQKVNQRKRESIQRKSRQPIVNSSIEPELNSTKKSTVSSKKEIKKARNKKVSLERSLVDAPPASIDQSILKAQALEEVAVQGRIKLFESELDPFEISLLGSGHFVLYRKVWRDEQRFIQGLIIEQSPFIDSLVRPPFADSLLAEMSTLTVIYQGNVLANLGSRDRLGYSMNSGQFDGTLLYRTGLSEPFSQLNSIFTIHRLPAGPAGKVIVWASFILAAVLSIGVFLLYRMSVRNINLVNQQQDFVSAVSHELKTPLTSIRMYGEILKQGWADEEKKKGYYSFIFDESERLTRLINNVLSLARMTRNETQVALKEMSVAQLMDIINSKVESQIERSEFVLNLSVDEDVSALKLNIDPDVFSQIIINLVDNAIKFSAHADNKVVDITATLLSNNKVAFSVRDYGPGIVSDQLKKIFELFYRSENELTRETTGTGIGLALVHQLTQLMNGKIDATNLNPGAQFTLTFSPKPSRSS